MTWGSLCCCSVMESCWTLCDPMDCSTPGFPVRYFLLPCMSNTCQMQALMFTPFHLHMFLTLKMVSFLCKITQSPRLCFWSPKFIPENFITIPFRCQVLGMSLLFWGHHMCAVEVKGHNNWGLKWKRMSQDLRSSVLFQWVENWRRSA